MEEDQTREEPGENEVGLRRVRKPNFWIAMGAYAALAVMAGLTFNGPSLFETRLRVLVWLLLGALAVRTWIHRIRQRQ